MKIRYSSIFCSFFLIFGFVSLSGPVMAGEAPVLTKLVKAGKLPPLEQRLPPNPVVVKPVNELGKYGGTLNIGIKEQYSWFGDPQSAIGPDGLLRFSSDFQEILPNLIRKWEWSNDGKTVTVHLLEGAKWSDGQPFTADDVQFFYEDVLLNKELYANMLGRWAPGGEPMKLTQLGKYTIRYDFAVPYPVIELEWAHYHGGQYSWGPKHYLKNFHPKYTDESTLEAKVKEGGFDSWVQLFKAKSKICSMIPCAKGLPTMSAFVVEESKPEFHRLKRNPYYWKVDTAGNQLPYVDEVTLAMYSDPEVLSLKSIQGEFDIFGQNADLANFPVYKNNQDKAGYNMMIWKTTNANFMGFQFNLTMKDPVKRKIVNDRRFRIAVSHAFDREEVNDARFFGMVEILNTTAHPDSPFYVEEFAKAHIEHDPKKSNNLLDEMGLTERDSDGYRKMPDGRTLEFAFVGEDLAPWAPPVVELVTAYLKDVGIKVTAKFVSRDLYRAISKSNDVEFGQHVVWGFFNLFQSCPNAFVPCTEDFNLHWSKLWSRWYETKGAQGEEPPPIIKELHKMFVAMRSTTYQEKRIEYAREIQRVHAEERFIISTLGPDLKPILVNKRLGNVPTKGVHGYDGIRMQPFHPETFYFKN